MKHSPLPNSLSLLSQLFLKKFNAGIPVLIDVNSPSLVSFILSLINSPFLVLCRGASFDDVYASFGLNRSEVVGVPFLSSI